MSVHFGLETALAQPVFVRVGDRGEQAVRDPGSAALAEGQRPGQATERGPLLALEGVQRVQQFAVVGFVGLSSADAATSSAPAAQPTLAAPPRSKPGLYFCIEACQYFSAGVSFANHGKWFIGT